MANQQSSSKGLNIALWIVQVFLAAGFIWSACMKLFTPIDNLSLMWPWTAHMPLVLVRGLGLIDLLGGLGILLPSLLRIQPRLTPVAAVCIIVLMVCAGVFHILRGEISVIGVNIVFAILAAFIAWGRFRKAPVLPK